MDKFVFDMLYASVLADIHDKRNKDTVTMIAMCLFEVASGGCKSRHRSCAHKILDDMEQCSLATLERLDDARAPWDEPAYRVAHLMIDADTTLVDDTH